MSYDAKKKNILRNKVMSSRVAHGLTYIEVLF